LIGFFRKIRQQLIGESKISKYLLYAIGEILLVVIGKPCPVRDYLSVEIKRPTLAARAVRYDICRAMHSILNHIVYQPVGRHGLRHAGFLLAFCFLPIYCPYGT